jgi:hypothetical protein
MPQWAAALLGNKGYLYAGPCSTPPQCTADDDIKNRGFKTMKQDRFLCGESLLASADGRFILMLELDLALNLVDEWPNKAASSTILL